MAKSDAVDYKSILVKNETTNSTVFLYVYAACDHICWLSYVSKSIQPGKCYLQRSESSFKYEVKIQRTKEKRKRIVPPTLWKQNKRLLVNDDEDVTEDDLSRYPHEHRICIRRNNMARETSANYGRDLYGILKLDMKEVRNDDNSLDEQDKIIIRAYRKQMLIYHPDRNPDLPDSHLCQEIIMAYSILGDRKKRAKYHDAVDYGGGWFSGSRWSAIFKPESHGSCEKWKRIGLLGICILAVIGGGALTFLTAGLATPVVIACNIVGGAAVGAGIQGCQRTVSFDSVANGIKLKKFLQSVAIGTVSGALCGGVTAGIASALVGIGSSALPAAEISIADYLTTGAVTGSVTGAVTSVSSQADKALVDGEDASWKEVALRGLAGAVIGGLAGVAGGAVTKLAHGSAAAATVEGEGAEQVGIRWATRKFVARNASTLGTLTEKTGKSTMVNGVNVVEEKIKDEPENPLFSETNDPKDHFENQSINYKEAIFHLYNQMSEEQNPLFAKEEDNAPNGDEKSGLIRYICDGWYYSRMIVQYVVDGREKEIIVNGSRSTVDIPEHAESLKVKFQNMRFINTWCDVKKYDRHRSCWCQPKVAHVFTFDKPVTRTFTLEGSLHYVAVMKITNEQYDELD